MRLREEYLVPMEHHNPIEMFGSTAMYEADGSLTIYEKTQGVQNCQKCLCGAFRLSIDKVRVLSPYVGGAFGSGTRPEYQLFLAAVAALDLKRSVRVSLTRQQMFSFGHRPVTLGAAADGVLQSIIHEAITETSLHDDYSENVVNMEAILALNRGATRTRCMAIDRSGRILAEAERGASNHLQGSGQAVRAALTDAVEESLRLANLRKCDVKCLSAGLAGVDYDGYGAEPMLTLFRELGFERCLISGDMVVAHAGALEVKPGIFILAGTGSAIYGSDASGRSVKVGGWGPAYGDEGSAHWIAVEGMKAAARAYDGCGPGTALL